MFAQAEVLQCFPSCVWVHRLPDAEAMNEALLSEVYALRERDDRGLRFAPGLWQSPTDLYMRGPFAGLTEAIVAASKGVLDFLQYKYENFYITDCWANTHGKGGTNHLHKHPNNLLSGVYYVQVPPGSGDIVFVDPRPQSGIIIPAVRERTPFNSFKQRITPEAGKLLMFHSWFEHEVEPNKSEVERVSIAFNIMLHGRVGYESGGAVF